MESGALYRRRRYDFTEAESARIRVAVETWDSYSVNADHLWLEPLLAGFYSPAAI